MIDFSFIPAARNASEAAFQARVMDRAKTLLADGYRVYDRFERNPDCFTLVGSYFVHSPEGDLYEVNTVKKTCECKCCVKNKFCKHLLYCLMAEDKAEAAADEAMVAAYEADMAACEDEKTGVGSWF